MENSRKANETRKRVCCSCGTRLSLYALCYNCRADLADILWDMGIRVMSFDDFYHVRPRV